MTIINFFIAHIFAKYPLISTQNWKKTFQKATQKIVFGNIDSSHTNPTPPPPKNRKIL